VSARRYLNVAFHLAALVQALPLCHAAERYVFQVFGEDQGLGSLTITRLVPDHQGALWIGTENGLYRYDGHRFLAFTTDDGLPDNRISAIHESPDGTLWVGTSQGLAWKSGAGFRKSANQWLKYYLGPQGIASDQTGRVFLATRNGVAVTSAPATGKDLQLSFLPWPASVPLAHTGSVYAPSPDAVWFGCDTSICMWNGTRVRVWSRDADVPSHKWDLFLKDKSGNLWVRNRDALIELESGANRFKTVDPEFAGQVIYPPELAMDSDGRILVTTTRGLAIGGPNGWSRVTQKQGLPSNFVSAVLQDAQGSIWLGTYGAGLAHWAGYGSWRSFTEMEGLASSSIGSLLDDPPSGMWAGTATGLSHGVFSKGTWNWSEIRIPKVEWVSCLVRSKDGALWMLTTGHYVVRFDPVSRASRRLGPFADGPYHIRFDEAGRLWVADTGSIAVGSPQSRLEEFERIRPPGTIGSTAFTSTLEDAHGDLWIGSMSGLFRRSRGKWFRYGSGDGLHSTKIIDLALSPEGDLWLNYAEPRGTDRVRAAGDALRVENFNRSNGLISDAVNSIGFDRNGQSWVLNDSGVSLRRGNTWFHFSQTDGMIGNNTAGRAFWAAADGGIWIGTERGLSRYQPSETIGVDPDSPRPKPLHVVFSEVRIGNRTLDPALGNFIEATPQAFEAKFSALQLARAAEVQYRYRIDGFEDHWRETVRPEVRLDYLPPGRYRLEVQARTPADSRKVQGGNGASWTGPTATLSLEVRPRWYATWLFRGLLLALACAAVWLLAQLRERKAAAAQRALERTVDQRTGELRESEERFRNMADTAPVMIWISGPDRLFTFFNKTWLDFTGRTIEQELGNGWAEGVHPEDLDRCIASYVASFDARENFEIECRLRRADEQYRWVLCRGVPRFTPGGVFAGYIGSNIDLTDLKRAEKEVLSRQKLESLGVLTAGIAHDFNNLLGSILADAELADAEMADADPSAGSAPRQEVRRIKAVAIRAAEIVRELMIYSGQDKATLEPVEVSRLVEEMLELLKVSISKHAVLKIDLGRNLPAVRANAPQLRQVVMNLMINASEAIGTKDGVIRVSTSRVTSADDSIANGAASLPSGDYLRLEVSDTGGGMTDEQKARIFDPFFSTKFAGRGLGLAVVQGIVRGHNGAIHLVSAPGQGTTFRIFLPCAGEPLPEQLIATVPTSRAQITGTKTVLVVEDEASLRLSVSKMLRKKGFSVIEATDGSVAIDLLRARGRHIDAILLDMTIPGKPSHEVLAEAVRIRPDVEVILTSAYSREMVVPSADAPHVKGFIRKPFRLEELVHLLRDTLSA